MLEYGFVLYNHGLWSDSFLKDYLMVLPYLNGIFYILLSPFLWIFLDILLSRGYSLCRFTIIGFRALSLVKVGISFPWCAGNLKENIGCTISMGFLEICVNNL